MIGAAGGDTGGDLPVVIAGSAVALQSQRRLLMRTDHGYLWLLSTFHHCITEAGGLHSLRLASRLNLFRQEGCIL